MRTTIHIKDGENRSWQMAHGQTLSGFDIISMHHISLTRSSTKQDSELSCKLATKQGCFELKWILCFLHVVNDLEILFRIR